MSKKAKMARRIASIIVIAGGIVWMLAVHSETDTPQYETVPAARGTVTEEVLLTGTVKPEEERKIAFKHSAAVEKVLVDVGDRVAAGDVLAVQESAELRAELARALASLDAERARLAELESGLRPEEVALARTQLENAQRALDNALEQDRRVREQQDRALTQKRESLVTALRAAVQDARDALVVLSEIQQRYFTATSQDGLKIGEAKALAIDRLFGVPGASFWTAESVSELDGGLYGAVYRIPLNVTATSVPYAGDVRSALNAIRDAFEAIPLIPSMSTSDRTNMVTQKDVIMGHIATVTNAEQSFLVEAANYERALAASRINVTAAQNAVLAARDTLALKESGYTPEQIEAQRAKVQVARASVSLIQTQIAQRTLRAPIDGVVARVDAKEGVLASALAPVITLLSENNLYVETHIPEADIARVYIDAPAHMTFDAYEDRSFNAAVTEIDPAQTIMEGVPTYRAKLRFTENYANLLRPGMTADVTIVTAQHANAIVIPIRVVSSKEGVHTVRVVEPDGSLQTRRVTLGIHGSDGSVEVLSGLREGERVVAYMPQ